MRSAVLVALAILPASLAWAQRAPYRVRVANPAAHERAPAVIRCEMSLSSRTVTVRNAAGADVPAHYDRGKRTLLIHDRVGAGGQIYTVHPRVRSASSRSISEPA